VERTSGTVGEHQGKVDRLEARGRAFRANLGHAIDELVHDRSRERVHAEAVRTRQGSLGGDPSGEREALVWESAALDEELERAEERERDLSFQIETLQRKLDDENEVFERELVEASGALEGSLSALRLLTSELVRMLDESAKLVSSEKRG
jgi:serine/threonine-protein kinase